MLVVAVANINDFGLNRTHWMQSDGLSVERVASFSPSVVRQI